MSEKIREAFESWAISCHMCTYLDGVGYRHQSTEWAWMAWQASRAALVVELPSDINGEYYADGWNAALMCVEEILKDSGVSCK